VSRTGTLCTVLAASFVLAAGLGGLRAEPLYAPDAETAYDRAVQTWKTAEDVNAWVAASFSYDVDRAVQLSATQRQKNGTIAIHEPAPFFETGSGVCVDLARFGVETLRRVAPQSEPRYVMLELEPAQIRGSTLRLHWLVSFRRDDKLYFFADSKRPGHIAGPYDDTQAFVASYAYDGRRVISFREVETYEKTRRSGAVMRHRAPAAP
jgi:hypothetical protein